MVLLICVQSIYLRMVLDLTHQPSDFSYSIVFFLDFSVWNTLESEDNFKLRPFVVRHGSLRSGTTLMKIFALNLPGIFQNNFGWWTWR